MAAPPFPGRARRAPVSIRGSLAGPRGASSWPPFCARPPGGAVPRGCLGGGRPGEIGQLATLLRSPAERADPAGLVVVGPSGCGKSSLARAGLLPVMAAEAEWWTLPAILPGTAPVAALARELAASARRVGLGW